MDIRIKVICEWNGIVDTLRLPETKCNSPVRSSLTSSEYKRCDDENPENVTQETELSAKIESQELVDPLDHLSELESDTDKIQSPSSDDCDTTGKSGSGRTCTSVRLCMSMDPMLASCLTTELRRSRQFESCFSESLKSKISMAERFRWQYENTDEESHFQRCDAWIADGSHLPRIHVHLRIWLNDVTKYFTMEPDIRWSNRMLPQLSQRVQMEETFSWLSTLGGAYSSLGDNMYNCAVEAGRVALRQLYLAERLGDATLRARCLLYIALSLMQTGRLGQAKRLVRQQYKFATSGKGCYDSRLVAMCLGIWHHLRHHYAKRKET